MKFKFTFPAFAIALLLGAYSPHAKSSAVASTQADQQAVIQRITDFVAKHYSLPGLAVGVVGKDGVIYSEARGELLAGSNQRVNSQTLFKIASNTKAMTAALLARLVDQGKLGWEDPVVKYLPDFAMHDPWVTRHMQVRDLLIHNSGLGAGAGDLMLWPEPNLFTRKEVIHGLRYLKPQYSFRSRYAYDNTLYIVAGQVAAAAGGAPYDVLIRREVFEPLGMRRCQVGAWDREAVGNVAQPHAQRDGRNVVVRADPPQVADVPMMAAGGIRCSLDDMLKWVAMWLQPESSGVVNGTPWLSEAQRRAVWTPQTTMPLSQRMRDWDNSHYSAYGYGWRLTDVDGTWKVSHTGTLSGMYSSVTLLPEKGVGIVIMINADADEARTVLTQALIKHFTAPQRNFTAIYYADLIARDSPAVAEKQPPAKRGAPVDADHAYAWLGRYRDPWLGEASICKKAHRVEFSASKSPKLTGQVYVVDGRHYVVWDDPTVDTNAWLDFDTQGRSKPKRLTMAKVDSKADFSSDFEDLRFSRIGDCGGIGIR